jgi:hypothetical protein
VDDLIPTSADQPSGSPLWHTFEDEQSRAEAVIRTCDALTIMHAERRYRTLLNLEVYEGKRLGGLYPSAYLKSTDFTNESYDKLRLNEARSIVNTAIAKIAGKQRPRAQFCCSEADWSIRRRAKKLEKYVDAVMLQRQNGQTDAFQVGLLFFRDLCVADSGWLKIWADKVQKRVCIQRVLPWEMLVDPNEARYGEPQNLFHVYGYDRYLLAEQFPERREEIMAAKGIDEDMHQVSEGGMLYGYGADVARMVKVREAWRLPIGPDVPGKHSIVLSSTIGGIDLTVTKENPEGEQWLRPFFPFIGGTWEPHLMGIFGTSLIDNIAGLCDELNATIQRRAEAETLGSNLVIFAEEGAVAREDLEDNRPVIVITKKQGSPDPTFVAPNTTSQGSVQWAQQLQDWAHDASGVSKQDTAAQREPGVDSGIAIREIRDIGSERFSIQWQNYEKIMSVELARHILACTQELAEELGDDIIVKWPGGDYFEDLKWSKVKLAEEQYHIQVYAVSGLVNTPADRLALATELVDRGFMSKEVYLRVIQAKDIDSELGKTNSVAQWMEKCIEQWMDATEKDLESGVFRYRGPPPRYLGAQVLTDAILQAGLAYLDADMANCPQWNLQFFERFMKETDICIQELLNAGAQREAAEKGRLMGTGANSNAGAGQIGVANGGGPAPPPGPAGAAPGTPSAA